MLYDGWCNLCDSAVVFLLRRDREAVFRFAALQSPAAGRLLADCAPAGAPDQTMVVVDGGRCLTRSEAALAIVRRLPPPWPLLFVLRLIPRRLRDAVYDLIARNRARWFGRKSQCMLSLAPYKDRFLEA